VEEKCNVFCKSYKLWVLLTCGTTSPMHMYLRNFIVRFEGTIHNHKCILTQNCGVLSL